MGGAGLQACVHAAVQLAALQAAEKLMEVSLFQRTADPSLRSG
jgi:hypothetical protein